MMMMMMIYDDDISSQEGKVAIVQLECWWGPHLPLCAREPVGGNTTTVCDAWPVRRQTYTVAFPD